ncbi:F0F1 ATP synthase subunit gamma [Patescibacteria group bacterium]|nr:F0F1 ATP synthase subunit gamma [Patescibacteria group bacterium]
MISKQTIVKDIQKLGSIKELVEVYEEIAATRMRKIRDSVLHSRDFLTGITQVYKEVQSSYEDQLVRIMKKKRIQDRSKLSVIKKNGKSISVFVGANTGLYGDIIKRTLNLFLEGIKNERGDVAVIGRLAKTLMEESSPSTKFTYYEFPDSHVDEELLKRISSLLVQYEKVTVYFGQFQNVVNQIPSASVISDADVSAQEQEIKFKSFFEPSLEDIMTFFETEIFTSIFEQTMHESQLAKFASRMITLDKSIENIKEELRKVEFERRIINHRSMNQKQLEQLSGLTLWNS